MKKTSSESDVSNEEAAGDADVEDEIGSATQATSILKTASISKTTQHHTQRHRSRSRTPSPTRAWIKIPQPTHVSTDIDHSPKYLEPKEWTPYFITQTLFKWLIVPFIQGMFYACGEGLSRHVMAKYCGIPWYRPKIVVEHCSDSFVSVESTNKTKMKYK